METSRNLAALIADTIQYLSEVMRYSAATVTNHKMVYGMLRSYCADNAIELYTQGVGERFMTAKRQQRRPVCQAGITRYYAAIRHLNSVMTGAKWQPVVRPPKELSVPDYFRSILLDYECYLSASGKTKCNVRQRVLVVARFLSYVGGTNHNSLTDLTAKLVIDAFQNSSDKAVFRRYIAPFLKYAHVYNFVKEDLSVAAPSVVRHKTYPSVYSPEEVERLLASVDRSGEQGKRDYAIILVAARLGLRASDISAMTLDCLRLEKGTLEIVQKKTDTPLVLPLTDEVKTAIFDYIDNGRPQSDEPRIFLNLRGYGAPMPASIGGIVHKAFLSSGIDLKGRRSCSHALRASLATALLAEGNDYYTVQQVLGQRDVNSVQAYAAVDVEGLRVNALPVPMPTGNFEILLSEGGKRNEKLRVFKRVLRRTAKLCENA